ncbi:MAG: hypothetical protein KI790_00240 [Cyclobacteriaceae bacterium]|nr:hypothetical protein [Cyclobacteriaceae bacterium HetDA_MAG_MS6]
MSRKLDEAFLAQYKNSFVDKIIATSFNEGETLSGKELINLTPVKQINFFVLKQLFSNWQAEIKQLDSPYFNYKATEVRKAMVQFMNVLSQHIQVGSEALKPLLDRATHETILIHLDPVQYLQVELEPRAGTVFTDKTAKHFLKYLKVMKEDFQDFFQQVIGSSTSDVLDKGAMYFDQLDLQNVIHDLSNQLSSVSPVAAEDFFEKDKNVINEPASIDDSQVDDLTLEDDLEIDEESLEPEHVVTTMQQAEESINEEEEEPEVDEELTEESVNAHFEDETRTVNEEFQAKVETIGDHLENQKVNSIMEAISINHRYMFAQELFDGSNDDFQQAIHHVEQLDTFDDAVEFLVQSYAKDRDWDMNSDEVKELLKVIFRKFR